MKKQYPVLWYRGIPIRWLDEEQAWAVNLMGLYDKLPDAVARIDRLLRKESFL